jgi:hypothetical protein
MRLNLVHYISISMVVFEAGGTCQATLHDVVSTGALRLAGLAIGAYIVVGTGNVQ